MVIIALCVFSEAILGAAMPSKEAARKSRKKENNRAYYEAQRESILYTSTAVNADHSVILMSTTKM